VFISEIAPKDIRVGLATSNQLFICSGCSAAYIIGALLSWWSLVVVGLVPCAVLLVGLFFIPESPRAPDDCDIDLDVLTDDEARVYHSNDVQFSTIREPGVVILDSDPFERVYNNLPSDHLVLRKVLICEYCGAIRFPGEGPGFCCRQGKVNLVNTPVPDDLQRLFTSQTDRDALCFRKKYSVFQLSFLVHKLWSYRGSSGRYCSC